MKPSQDLRPKSFIDPGSVGRWKKRKLDRCLPFQKGSNNICLIFPLDSDIPSSKFLGTVFEMHKWFGKRRTAIRPIVKAFFSPSFAKGAFYSREPRKFSFLPFGLSNFLQFCKGHRVKSKLCNNRETSSVWTCECFSCLRILGIYISSHKRYT